MCTQGMGLDLLYVRQMSKLRTFQELASKTQEMETMIANRDGMSSSTYKFKKDKGNSKKTSKSLKALTNEAMIVSIKEPM